MIRMELIGAEAVQNGADALGQPPVMGVKGELYNMKKKVEKCCLVLLTLALAAGIFCVFWGWKPEELGKNGTLVKNIGKEWGGWL